MVQRRGKIWLGGRYQGPGIARQKIPDSVLYRLQTNAAGGGSNWVHGLDYRCVEAPVEILPDFDASPKLGEGTVSNFDLRVMYAARACRHFVSRDYRSSAEGFILSYTTSDDGSRLLAGDRTLRVTVLAARLFPSRFRWPSARNCNPEKIINGWKWKAK